MKPIPITHLKEIKRLLKQGKHTHKEIARMTRTGVNKVNDISTGKFGYKPKAGYWDDRTTNILI